MKSRFFFLVFISCQLSLLGQINLPAGYTDRSPSLDVLPGFLHPPKGFGEVPFYWWQGDTLTRERIAWQLNQLQDRGISSLQINYSHTDVGGQSYGLSRPSKPALFTNAWWDLFRWFADEAQKRGMNVSLSDYTLGVGQGFAVDDALKENPDLNGSVLRSITITLKGKGSWKLPERVLNLTGYQLKSDGSIVTTSRKELNSQVKEGILFYDFGNEAWRVTCVNENPVIPSYDPMNPLSGQAYIHHFFDRFENALPKGSKALDFFFSDELDFRLSGNLWDKYFSGEFKKRKGYDITPYLDALYTDIGNKTAMIRLDYNDVLVSLSEEHYFKPIFDWHHDRGLIYGCDHSGRGKNVAEFGDYFRTHRWLQGPGSDQPGLAKDIIKAKVASSIAHLYERPRVWLEGFYGSGWGTTSANFTDAVLANYLSGYNLISFHGLYYSTQGGWWEWAPPCNHFRMPYWQQIDPLMNCIQRLSYTLSQGCHVCDVAIVYPTEPVVASMDGKRSVDIAFGTGTNLYAKGIDFDFIDYGSIARAEAKNGALEVSGEKYKIIIVPSMKAIRYATLQKLLEFKKTGGIIVNIGSLPEATEKEGANDPQVSKLVSTLFAQAPNFIQCKDQSEVTKALEKAYTPNFRILSEVKDQPYVMHRKAGKRDIYALYNLPQGTRCSFKSRGTVQLWNPWNGEISSLSRSAKPVKDGTEITLPLTNKEIQLIVFSPETNVSKEKLQEVTIPKITKEIAVDDKWEFELKPCLDNQWGDFQLPATKELMGAQVRQLYLQENKTYHGEKLNPDSSWKNITCEYGQQFLKLGPLSQIPDEAGLLRMIPRQRGETVGVANKKLQWEDYGFSWQHGVEGDFGHQGYHGLKGEMYDNFIRLGAIAKVKHSMKRSAEAEGNYYLLYTNVLAPSEGTYEMLTGDLKPAYLFINNTKTDPNLKALQLKAGSNSVLAVYNKACETYLVFRKPGVALPAKQQVSMCWYGDQGLLPFDCSYVTHDTSGLYVFQSAPALQSFTFAAYGKVSLWVDGVTVQPEVTKQNPDGLTFYQVNLKESHPESAQVVLHIDYQPGYTQGAAIPQFFREQCGKGVITLGDWSKIDGLKAYSGGAWYRKTIHLNAEDLNNKLWIDLGDLVSSAQLFVNGTSAGIKLTPPWKYEISKLVKTGDNKVEVLLYNTLSNNYTTIPTIYRGDIKAGLLGPVKLLISK
ncbi:MAG: glycosyl hydrolase [Bacteroidota bacterium]|nr:glycosyl hydrolase [Bacteroidota bacterium]